MSYHHFPLPTHRLTEYRKDTPPGTFSHLEQSPPTPIKPRSKGTAPNYSAVNDLAFLPDEVRTPENLEPGQLTGDNAQLLDEYRRKRDEYEEAQLAMSQPERTQEHASPNAATRVMISPESESREQQFFKPSLGYEDIEIETTEPMLKTTTETYHQSAPSRSTNHGYDSPIVGSTPRIGDYNNPIDYLPTDHFLLDKTVKPSAPKASTKIISTSVDTYSEVFDSRESDGGGNIMVILPKVRAMSDSKPVRESSLKKSNGSPSHPGRVYENGPLEVGSSGRPAHSMDNVTGFGERLDCIRQSKRDDVKEVVELDFTKKKFRVTSTRRKDMTGGEVSPSGAKEESYAVVNLADKRCYRAESDNIKQEGSGFPRHYGPEAMSAVVTVPT